MDARGYGFYLRVLKRSLTSENSEISKLWRKIPFYFHYVEKTRMCYFH